MIKKEPENTTNKINKNEIKIILNNFGKVSD